MSTLKTKKPRQLHFNSLLSAHNGEAKNPHIWSSPNWCAWEAIQQARRQGQVVVDAWMSRGCSVNVRTPDSVTIIKIL